MSCPLEINLLNGFRLKYEDPSNPFIYLFNRKRRRFHFNIHYSCLLFVDPPTSPRQYLHLSAVSLSLIQASKAWSSGCSLISSIFVICVFWVFPNSVIYVFWVLIKLDIHVWCVLSEFNIFETYYFLLRLNKKSISAIVRAI